MNTCRKASRSASRGNPPVGRCCAAGQGGGSIKGNASSLNASVSGIAGAEGVSKAELARIIAAPKALPWEVDGTLKGQSEALRLRMHHVLDSGLLLRG